MPSCLRFVLVPLLLFGLFAPSVQAGQPKTSAKPPTLRQLLQRAGYIFTGTVLKVERIQTGAANEVATVQITFRVDQAVRGVSPKQLLSIHEWAGLWNRGQRYRPGQRVLLFLYRSSKLGLTSPVGGDYGRFELDGGGRILAGPTRLAGLQLEPPFRTYGKKVPVNARELTRAILQTGGEGP